MDVDLILLSRDASPPRPDVRAGIEAQAGVRLRVHRVHGTREPGDTNRLETIVRARNACRGLGGSPWVMLLDDDVVLGPHCVARLVDGLSRRPTFAALGADCAGQMRAGLDHWDYPRHVGMASTLFRRERLRGLRFRWEPDKCECRCYCEDLRREGFGIGYLPGADAWHRPSPARPVGPAPPSKPPGRILAAFNRPHVRLFTRRFLGSLRASGNREPVVAVAYGLLPSERRTLSRLPGVEVVARPADGHPARRRLRDFAGLLDSWPGEAPAAYWDAGDVVFQDPIGPLWDLVRAHPDRILVAREQLAYRGSLVVISWLQTIHDPEARDRALRLLMPRPVLNSGFAAGTSRALVRYFREANRLLHSPALRGTTDWGDQTALNLFCADHPDACREVSRSWNYCLVALGRSDFRTRPDGRIVSLDGRPVHVVHGNGGMFGPQTLEVLSPQGVPGLA